MKNLRMSTREGERDLRDRRLVTGSRILGIGSGSRSYSVRRC